MPKAVSILLHLVTLFAVPLFLYAGFSGRNLLFVDSPRAAALAIGVTGMLLCSAGVGRFIAGAPAHPLTLLGYLIGAFGSLVFLVQWFQWEIPVLCEPKTAMLLLTGVIVVKFLLSRFAYLLPVHQ